MQNKELTERIRALGKLTPSESKIADYFSRNYWNLVFDNTTSISKNTDYLLAGERAGSKLSKAEKLNVKIIDENEFLNILSSQMK